MIECGSICIICIICIDIGCHVFAFVAFLVGALQRYLSYKVRVHQETVFDNQRFLKLGPESDWPWQKAFELLLEWVGGNV